MQHSFSSRGAAAFVGGDVDSTTIQRAIVRGELEAEKGPSKQSRYRISRGALTRWAAERGLAVVGDNGSRIDAATGEVLEDAEPTPIVKATAARARLAGVAPKVEAEPETFNVAAIVPSPAARIADSVSSDRLALLARLVREGHIEAAQLVVEAWAL
jgi:hypothetical protein